MTDMAPGGDEVHEQGDVADESAPAAGTVAAVFVPGHHESWIPTVVSLRAQVPDLWIVAGGPDADELASLEDRVDEIRVLPSPSALINAVHADHSGDLLFVGEPAILPPGALERATALVRSNLRCSSVSFLSNIAGFAGIPAAHHVSSHQVESLDEVAITRRLRGSPEGLEPVPIPYPVGPAVLISSQGLSLVRPFPDRGSRSIVSLADFGAQARSRGMVDMLDPATFVSRPTDVPGGLPPFAGLAPAEEAFLNELHPGVLRAVSDPVESESALQQALTQARAIVSGLRVVLDGSCIGPKEMGHQVTFLAQVQALAEREDIAYVGVALPVAAPSYAQRWLANPKIDVRVTPVGDLSTFPTVDIVHRPFQATAGLDPRPWRSIGRRLLITIHDLVAFEVPGYHESPDAWFAYRESTRFSTAEVDGIVAISEDTRSQIALERLAVDDQRVFVVPNGVGHLEGNEPQREPAELIARGFGGQPFLLVLGTNYTHKNRDLAIRVARELRDRGFDLALVMAGALVPFGSSRVAEAQASAPGEPTFTIPDVTSEERNWLLRHAEIVLYPSGAEGFGLIPHEAAAFGTPTVLVPFGPFGERLEGLPVAPADWSVPALADACAELLSDPAVAEAQVETIVSATPHYDWNASASALVGAYRSLLARPALASLRSTKRDGV